MTSPAQYAASLAVVALTLAVMHFGLLPAVFLGSVLFIGMRALEARLPPTLPHRNIISVTISMVCFTAVLVGVGFVSSRFLGPAGVAGLLLKLSTILDQLRTTLPESWRDYIPEGIDELKSVLAAHLKEHAQSLTQMSVHGLHLAAHMLLAVIVAAMLGVSPPVQPAGKFSAPLFDHLANFRTSTAKVFGAQLRVASINGVITGMFLLGVLPALGVHVPFALVASLLTFVLGMIPVVGNLLSNTLNVLLGLSVAPWVGATCLGFLVISHKIEYLLCARYVGEGVGAKTWELLSAMILLEAIYGPVGFVAAPVLYAWVKIELRKRSLL